MESKYIKMGIDLNHKRIRLRKRILFVTLWASLETQKCLTLQTRECHMTSLPAKPELRAFFFWTFITDTMTTITTIPNPFSWAVDGKPKRRKWCTPAGHEEVWRAYKLSVFKEMGRVLNLSIQQGFMTDCLLCAILHAGGWVQWWTRWTQGSLPIELMLQQGRPINNHTIEK